MPPPPSPHESNAAVEDPTFHPARWLPGPHAQTIVGRYLRSKRGVDFRRERLDTPDGDFIDLDFADVRGATWADLGEQAPVVLLLHGLEGSARTGYAFELYRQLAAVGIRAAGLNFRSCSGTLNVGARLYHSGDTADASRVLQLLADRYPDVPRAAVGISLGGNVLLKLLGEQEDAAPVQAAVTVSVPFDLDACADRLKQGASRMYEWYLLRQLRAKLRQKAALLGALCDVEAGLRARTFRAFDGAVTAPIHGFESAEDYYARSSSQHFLSRVRVPTLLLQAKDDPFLPPAGLPQGLKNPNLQTDFVPGGGHVGFVEGPLWRPTFWAERRATHFLYGELLASQAS